MVHVHNGTATLHLERVDSRIPFDLHLLLAGPVAKSLRESVSNFEVVRSLPKHYLCFLVELTYKWVKNNKYCVLDLKSNFM